jgi:hypothetical protein
MEQRAVIRFFKLKGLKSRATHTELEPVYDPEALALPTVKKCWRRSQQGRMDLFDDPRSGSPLANDLPGAIGVLLPDKLFSFCKVLCRHFQIGKATCLRILHDKLGLTISIFAAGRMFSGTTKERNSVIFEASSDGADGAQAKRL